MGILKYGMITDPSRDIVKEIRKASRMGFDYVELGMEIPEGHPDILRKRRRAIIGALKAFRHPPVGHTAYWFDIWSEYEDVRQAWLKVGRKSIDAAASVGCRKLNIHAPIFNGMYKYVESYKKRAIRNTVRSLREMVRYSSGRKVMIVMENLPEVYSMTIKEFSCIMDRTPGLGAHVDIGHAFVEGGMRRVSRYLRIFRNRLEHVHFSDNLGLQDDHIGIGQGIIDYERVMRLLRRIGYSKTITFEIFSGRKDLRDSLKAIKAMEEEIW
jgi:sugar phosphate isomerase/epimerase